MRLLTKININYLLLLGITFVVVTVSAFFVLRKTLIHQTKEKIVEEETLIVKQIAGRKTLPNLYPNIEVTEVAQLPAAKPGYRDFFIYNPDEKEMEMYLEYTSYHTVNHHIYKIIQRRSTFEIEDLAVILTGFFALLLLSSLIIAFFISHRLNDTVWTRFENNLRVIETFNITGDQSIQLKDTGISEFDRLNKVMNTLTQKSKNDYRILKEFSENASHEIQTPLSIALLNLEEMLQHNLPESTFRKVVETINVLKKLSSLNQSLITLTRIENGQFSFRQDICLSKLLLQQLNEFSALAENRNITVTIESEGDFVVSINEPLSGILISNLLSNAIRHNHENGKISIFASKNELRICNTGQAEELPEDFLFKRFKKKNSTSFGLGLAIVKNICDVSHLRIRYSKDEFHCFSITKL